MCSLTTEYVLLLQNVFTYYRICSLLHSGKCALCALLLQNVFSYYRMCSLTTEYVRFCTAASVCSLRPLTTECVLVFS